MNDQWTPANVILVVGALSTLIGALAGAIVTVIQVLKGQHETVQNALNQAANSVPLSTVQAMQSRGRSTDNLTATAIGQAVVDASEKSPVVTTDEPQGE